MLSDGPTGHGMPAASSSLGAQSPDGWTASGGVRAVERALDILLRVAERPGSTLAELASQLTMSKSTAHRLLLTLERRQVVEREPERRGYRPGQRLRNLLAAGQGLMTFRGTMLTEMQLLRELSGETITLHQLAGTSHVVVEQLESRHEIRRVHVVGQPIPLLTGATAKSLLAALPVDEARAILAANRTAEVGGPGEDELEDIRRVGYALSAGERVTGSCAISAPVRDGNGRAWGAMSIAGPAFRFTPARAILHSAALVRAAMRISDSLGAAFRDA